MGKIHKLAHGGVRAVDFVGQICRISAVRNHVAKGAEHGLPGGIEAAAGGGRRHQPEGG
jgi:hypothetical protein